MARMQRLHFVMIVMPRVSRRSAVAAMAIAGIGAACRATDTGTEPQASLDAIAERYVRLTLQLAQHQPSLVEAWLGPESWRPGPRRPVAELRQKIEETTALATATSEAERGERFRYLRQQLDALLIAARRLSGESIRFVEEARASLGSDVADAIEHLPPASTGSDTPATAAARESLEQRLPGRGALHERYAAFRSRHALARERIMPALQTALTACRGRVRPLLTLPDDESVLLEAATGLGLEARAIYERNFRSRVFIEMSGPLDLARLVWLVAHETYPGHHVQHVLADRDLVIGRNWHERALWPSFGRHLL